MSNEENINELTAYIEEHRHCPNKHTSLLNKTKYYRKKQLMGALTDEQAHELGNILAMRDMNEHTGGRREVGQIGIKQ